MRGNLDIVPTGVGDKDSVEVVGVDVVDKKGNDLTRGHGVSGHVLIHSEAILVATDFG
jgi:hypothetical protein